MYLVIENYVGLEFELEIVNLEKNVIAVRMKCVKFFSKFTISLKNEGES